MPFEDATQRHTGERGRECVGECVREGSAGFGAYLGQLAAGAERNRQPEPGQFNRLNEPV